MIYRIMQILFVQEESDKAFLKKNTLNMWFSMKHQLNSGSKDCE